MPDTSQLAGGPRVVWTGLEIRVVQSKTVGWALVAIGLFATLLFALANRAKIRHQPEAFFRHLFDGLSGTVAVMATLTGLLLILLTGFGLFWLLWTRDLSVSLSDRRYRFRTGVGPWIKDLSGALDALSEIHLKRRLRRSDRDTGGSPSPGESWEVRLAIPGSSEPLYLGEWGLRAEADAEIARWQAAIGTLKVIEDDGSPPASGGSGGPA